MLKKIHITNFLSCKDTEIEFDNITVLIGRNGAGKTNILKAIQEYAQFLIKKNKIQGDRDIFSYDAELLIGNNTLKYSIQVNNPYRYEDDHLILIEYLSILYDNQWMLIAKRNQINATSYYLDNYTELAIERRVSMITAIPALLPSEKISPLIKTVYAYLYGISYYALDNLSSRESSPIIHESYSSIHPEVYTLSGANPELSKLLHLWEENKSVFNELEELIGKMGLNLVNKIAVDKVDMGFNEPFYAIKFFIPNANVIYSGLSFGTQRILAILLALLYDKNTTLLIEQPEDGIHSGLLKKFLPICFEYAKAYNKQLIITTHSAEVINLVQPQQIRFVRMTENGTKVSALSSAQLALVADYIDNEGSLFEFIDGMEDDNEGTLFEFIEGMEDQ